MKVIREWLRSVLLAVLAGGAIVVSGCLQTEQAPTPRIPVPIVSVISPDTKTVPVYVECVGNVQAVMTAEIRARVEGFLEKRAFVEGADVKKGDLLFVIDKREYEAALEEAEATLDEDKAIAEELRLEEERFSKLLEQKSTSQSKYDERAARATAAEAKVRYDKVAVSDSKLKLSYCTMHSPLDGRIGLRQVDVGNLVGASEKTLLATVVQLDPVYVHFSPAAKHIPKIMKDLKEGGLKVEALLPEDDHVYHGNVDFVNNVVKSTTSTILLRAEVPNPDKRLFPGLYTRVRLLVDEHPNAILIPEEVILESQAGPYVLVLGAGNKVEQKQVVLGQTYGGMRVIEKGLLVADQIITDRLLQLKRGMEVQVGPVHDQK